MKDAVKPALWKLVLVGLVAGTVGGGLGVGGGIIYVPLLLAIGFDRHRAHATSQAAIVLGSTAGALTWAASGETQFATGILIGIGGVIGSVAGASLMHRMSTRNLAYVFGGVLMIAAVRMISGAAPLPGAGDLSTGPEIAIALGIGLIAGFFAGVAGVGGGVVIVPSTVFFLGLEQHQAQGTSLVAIVMTATAGTVVNLRNKRVRPVDGLVVGLGGVIGAVVGARIALGIEARTLSIVFGFVILFVALRTFYQAWKARSAVAQDSSSA